MMNILRNEKGIALPMVMMLSAILLAVMAALIFMITSRTELSGVQKRYYTAAEAGKGGLELTYLVIDQKMGVDTTITDQTLTAFLNSSNLAYFSPVKSTPSSCTGTTALGQYAGIAQTGLLAKLSTSSSTWSSNCNTSANIDPTDSSTYDLKFDFAGTNGRYRAFAKIVGTVEGLVGGGSLMKGGVVGGIGAQAGSHYIYTIEIDAENIDNPAERAKYSVLYLY
jgi:hypothetical protein